MTKAELQKKLKALGKIKPAQRKEIACSLIGHSRIISMCFGYVHCGRCEAQIGDRLGGYFDTTHSVMIGHNCEMCRENYEAMDWKDKFLVANPFAEAIRAAALASLEGEE